MVGLGLYSHKRTQGALDAAPVRVVPRLDRRGGVALAVHGVHDEDALRAQHRGKQAEGTHNPDNYKPFSTTTADGTTRCWCDGHGSYLPEADVVALLAKVPDFDPRQVQLCIRPTPPEATAWSPGNCVLITIEEARRYRRKKRPKLVC